jgi:hypothetical protein
LFVSPTVKVCMSFPVPPRGESRGRGRDVGLVLPVRGFRSTGYGLDLGGGCSRLFCRRPVSRHRCPEPGQTDDIWHMAPASAIADDNRFPVRRGASEPNCPSQGHRTAAARRLQSGGKPA